MVSSTPTSMRLDPVLREALAKAAKEADRTFTGQVEHIVRAWLKERGYLPNSEP